MQTDQKKISMSKFPLRLMPSLRKSAEAVSEREGVSLNQFINVAVAEKLAVIEHNEWLARRPNASPERIKRALEILNRETGNGPASGDELPEGDQSTSR
jgi:hypothetical protein